MNIKNMKIMATVREKMNDILKNGNHIDCGQYPLDGREKGILQHKEKPEIIVVQESKNDMDDNGRPLIKEIPYKNLKEFLKDYNLTY